MANELQGELLEIDLNPFEYKNPITECLMELGTVTKYDECKDHEGKRINIPIKFLIEGVEVSFYWLDYRMNVGGIILIIPLGSPEEIKAMIKEDIELIKRYGQVLADQNIHCPSEVKKPSDLNAIIETYVLRSNPIPNILEQATEQLELELKARMRIRNSYDLSEGIYIYPSNRRQILPLNEGGKFVVGNWCEKLSYNEKIEAYIPCSDTEIGFARIKRILSEQKELIIQMREEKLREALK